MTRPYKGRLYNVDGTWWGELSDAGKGVEPWPIRFRVVKPARPDGSFALEGELTETPPGYWVEAIDGERPK